MIPSQKKPKRGLGSRPVHHPTEATRAQVESLAAFGITHEHIAAYLDIDPKTLRKHYAENLELASVRANVEVARALFKSAMDGNIAAQIFWMKARCRWTETARVEHDGLVNPITIQVVKPKDAETTTDQADTAAVEGSAGS